ncbi:hypothetical protein ABK040_011510 [Willaertia magna]
MSSARPLPNNNSLTIPSSLSPISKDSTCDTSPPRINTLPNNHEERGMPFPPIPPIHHFHPLDSFDPFKRIERINEDSSKKRKVMEPNRATNNLNSASSYLFQGKKLKMDNNEFQHTPESNNGENYSLNKIPPPTNPKITIPSINNPSIVVSRSYRNCTDNHMYNHKYEHNVHNNVNQVTSRKYSTICSSPCCEEYYCNQEPRTYNSHHHRLPHHHHTSCGMNPYYTSPLSSHSSSSNSSSASPHHLILPSSPSIIHSKESLKGKKTIVAKFLAPNNCAFVGTPIMQIDRNENMIMVSGLTIVYKAPSFTDPNQATFRTAENGSSLEIRVPIDNEGALNKIL